MNTEIERLLVSRPLPIRDADPENPGLPFLVTVNRHTREIASWHDAAAVIFAAAGSPTGDQEAEISEFSDLRDLSERSSFEVIRGMSEAFRLVVLIHAEAASGSVLIHSIPDASGALFAALADAAGLESGETAVVEMAPADLPAVLPGSEDLCLDEQQEVAASGMAPVAPDGIAVAGHPAAPGDLTTGTDEVLADVTIDETPLLADLADLERMLEDEAVLPASVTDAGETDTAADPAEDAIDAPVNQAGAGKTVIAGAVVTIARSNDRREILYIIDPAHGESHEERGLAADMGAKPVMSYSPTGAALIGKGVGDDVRIMIKGKPVRGNITDIVTV